MKEDADPRRLNWGCGAKTAPGWINSDREGGSGVDLRADIRNGLPIEDDCVDYIASMHALQDLPFLDVLPALRELRRVLRPGGVLRLGLPDLDRAIDAYIRRDPAYFYIPDEEARSLGGKLVAQIVWYGAVRTPFTYDFIEELLARAGFARAERSAFGCTSSRFPAIVDLDNRERETLFVEASK